MFQWQCRYDFLVLAAVGSFRAGVEGLKSTVAVVVGPLCICCKSGVV